MVSLACVAPVNSIINFQLYRPSGKMGVFMRSFVDVAVTRVNSLINCSNIGR